MNITSGDTAPLPQHLNKIFSERPQVSDFIVNKFKRVLLKANHFTAIMIRRCCSNFRVEDKIIMYEVVPNLQTVDKIIRMKAVRGYLICLQGALLTRVLKKKC